MKKLICYVTLLSMSATASAIDFDTEWKKFQNDFISLASLKTSKPKERVESKQDETPSVNEKTTTFSIENKPLEVKKLEENEVDPKDPARLGHNLSDASMREKMKDLYSRPDIKVYSYVLR